MDHELFKVTAAYKRLGPVNDMLDYEARLIYSIVENPPLLDEWHTLAWEFLLFAFDIPLEKLELEGHGEVTICHGANGILVGPDQTAIRVKLEESTLYLFGNTTFDTKATIRYYILNKIYLPKDEVLACMDGHPEKAISKIISWMKSQGYSCIFPDYDILLHLVRRILSWSLLWGGG